MEVEQDDTESIELVQITKVSKIQESGCKFTPTLPKEATSVLPLAPNHTFDLTNKESACIVPNDSKGSLYKSSQYLVSSG